MPNWFDFANDRFTATAIQMEILMREYRQCEQAWHDIMMGEYFEQEEKTHEERKQLKEDKAKYPLFFLKDGII